MTSKKRGSRRDRAAAQARRSQTRKWWYVGLSVAAGLAIAVAVWLVLRQGDGDGSSGQRVQLAPASQLTGQVAAAPPVVREAYRFAIANPEVLSKIPCYCGCGAMDHDSNLDCFVESIEPDGSIVFGDHALG